MSENRETVTVDPRILFAAERTLFAYIRTGLALMGFGFVVARFGFLFREISLAAGANSPLGQSKVLPGWMGIFLVACGTILCAYSPVWYRATIARLNRGESYSAPAFGIGSTVALLVAGVGIAMAIYLAGFR